MLGHAAPPPPPPLATPTLARAMLPPTTPPTTPHAHSTRSPSDLGSPKDRRTPHRSSWATTRSIPRYPPPPPLRRDTTGSDSPSAASDSPYHHHQHHQHHQHRSHTHHHHTDDDTATTPTTPATSRSLYHASTDAISLLPSSSSKPALSHRSRKLVCEEDDWYRVAGGKRYSPYDFAKVPFYLPYEPAVETFYSILDDICDVRHGIPSHPAMPTSPQRVLEVGCGPSASWCVKAAMKPGWERTEVIGMDICPISLPLDHLDPNVVDRVTSLRHNIFDPAPLPFEDCTFDLIRVGFLSTSIPEDSWPRILDNLVRVLRPGCPIFISDHSHFLAQPPPSAGPFDLVREGVDSAFHSRLLAQFVTRTLPGAMSLCNLTGIERLSKVEKGKKRGEMILPMEPFSKPMSSPLDHNRNGESSSEEDGAANGHEMIDDHVTLETEEGDETQEEMEARVVLAAHADCMSTSRELFWAESGYRTTLASNPISNLGSPPIPPPPLASISSSCTTSNGQTISTPTSSTGGGYALASSDSMSFGNLSQFSNDFNSTGTVNTSSFYDSRKSATSTSINSTLASPSTSTSAIPTTTFTCSTTTTNAASIEWQQLRKQRDSARYEFDSAWDAWSQDLRLRASIGKLMSNRWGWKSLVDEKAQVRLSENLEFYKSQLKEVDELIVRKQKLVKDPLHNSHNTLENLVSRKSEAKKQVNQTETEIRNVKKRLGQDITNPMLISQPTTLPNHQNGTTTKMMIPTGMVGWSGSASGFKSGTLDLEASGGGGGVDRVAQIELETFVAFKKA